MESRCFHFDPTDIRYPNTPFWDHTMDNLLNLSLLEVSDKRPFALIDSKVVFERHHRPIASFLFLHPDGPVLDRVRGEPDLFLGDIDTEELLGLASLPLVEVEPSVELLDTHLGFPPGVLLLLQLVVVEVGRHTDGEDDPLEDILQIGPGDSVHGIILDVLHVEVHDGVEEFVDSSPVVLQAILTREEEVDLLGVAVTKPDGQGAIDVTGHDNPPYLMIASVISIFMVSVPF